MLTSVLHCLFANNIHFFPFRKPWDYYCFVLVFVMLRCSIEPNIIAKSTTLVLHSTLVTYFNTIISVVRNVYDYLSDILTRTVWHSHVYLGC